MQAVDDQVPGSGFQWAKADVFFADKADPPTGQGRSGKRVSSAIAE